MKADVDMSISKLRSGLRTIGILAAAMAACPAGAQPASSQQKRAAEAAVDRYADRMGRLGDAIYSYAEIGFQETKTVALVTKELRANGFTVETGVAGMPTAYVARYGKGGPVIGLMADFDGVPGTSQDTTSVVERPIVAGAPGHGEGHNTHQPTIIAAALAAKVAMERFHLPGTLVLFGGPAEEIGASRGYMVNAGLFKGLDAMIDVHVDTVFGTAYGLANFSRVSVQWKYKGVSGHGAQPWTGRSALDGVELLDLGVNYMREHGYNPDDARVHNVVTQAGLQPNIIPEAATDWYYIRAKSPRLVSEILDWVRDIAKGAAASTRTTVSEQIIAGTWPYYGNKALAKVLDANIQRVGMPQWSTDDIAFARNLQTALKVDVVGLANKTIPLAQSKQEAGTTDAGDVSWQVPMVRMRFPARPPGATTLHHWAAAVGVATPLAHKGMTVGAKALTDTVIDLLTDPALLKGIRRDFAAQLAGFPKWSSLLPSDAKVPLSINATQMARYRGALAHFEYNPDSRQTYLQFMKSSYLPQAGVDWRPSSTESAEVSPSSLNWQWDQ
ncbi:amidohydrolase [Sphingomonas sp. AP4-R1]|uniref:amidohydrolase n=1 Tax=Sphingomonas sp. AP4-R1 TaxID=2735134 RepID=UPI0014938296|nr:amidohydrolase [Sphingomonas sp. AP4-R1]QJU58219.1 amidohydrolase [Sphingomonas sp. AP4-R1]